MGFKEFIWVLVLITNSTSPAGGQYKFTVGCILKKKETRNIKGTYTQRKLDERINNKKGQVETQPDKLKAILWQDKIRN